MVERIIYKYYRLTKLFTRNVGFGFRLPNKLILINRKKFRKREDKEKIGKIDK